MDELGRVGWVPSRPVRADSVRLTVLATVGITLFLGGWQAPFAALDFVPSWAWFFVKLLGLIVLFIWTRGTLPRLRVVG